MENRLARRQHFLVSQIWNGRKYESKRRNGLSEVRDNKSHLKQLTLDGLEKGLAT